MSAALLLEPEPQSVRRARTWVVGELTELGRGDLTDSAELGVSELVTNAILHADPPITVRLGGTPQHPRVEVHDTSTRPPQVSHDLAADEALLRTVGRGLGIVAMYSRTWGADVSPQGKVVWFEPAHEPGLDDTPAEDADLDTLLEGLDGLDELGTGTLDGAAEGDLFDLAEAVSRRVAEAGSPETLVPICLQGMPPRLFAAFRTWYAEMRRELRILAFSHGDEYPVATEMADLIVQVEQERQQSVGVEVLDRAIADGVDRVDLEYQVPAVSGETMRRLAEVLDRVDEFSRHHQLLTLPAPPQVVELRRWYFGEFGRQLAGLDPIPWPGGADLEQQA